MKIGGLIVAVVSGVSVGAATGNPGHGFLVFLGVLAGMGLMYLCGGWGDT